MKDESAFFNPFRMLSPKLNREAYRLEELHNRPVTRDIHPEEGLLIMISKLIQMTRLLSECFVSGSGRKMDACARLAENVDELEKDLTGRLIAHRVEAVPLEDVIRFPYRLKRIGDMMESVLQCCRVKAENAVPFSDKAQSEVKELLGLLQAMMIYLRDAFHTPNKVLIEAVISNGRELFLKTEDCRIAHWRRLEQGFCAIEASSLYRDILDSIRWSGEYLIKMSKTLLELAYAAPEPTEACVSRHADSL